jgi:hypothetical protein
LVVGLILALVLSLFGAIAVSLAQPPTPSVAEPLQRVETATDSALTKIGPTLRPQAIAGGDELVTVNVFIKPGVDVTDYMEEAIVRTLLGQTSVFGKIKAKNLSKLSSHPGVVAVLDPMPYQPLPAPDSDVPSRRADAQAKIAERVAAIRAAGNPEGWAEKPQPMGWWDVLEGHDSWAAWDKGYTGEGVKVAVIDSGVDFAHPDLQGTWAVVEDTTSPYYGWPIAFDPYSIAYYAVYFGDYGPWVLDYVDTWYADTSTVVTGTVTIFDSKTYTTTGTSLSGDYHIGYHPDIALENWWYDEPVTVLVVDENVAGNYDTVYVDLDDDYDFTDEKAVTRDDPISWKDNWDSAADAPGSDGYADISGGMVYYISDGVNHPPAFDWLWGSFVPPFDPPEPGDVVAFMLSGAGFTSDHGQLCASAVVGQGVIDGGAPDWKPPASEVGGLVQGGGKDAKIIAMGDFYRGGSPSTDNYYFNALGYDGVPDTGDEADIVSMSFFSPATVNGGWDFESRLQAWINQMVAPQLTWLTGSGNGAPGYGIVVDPNSPTGLSVGASTQYGSTGTFDSITSTNQIVWGDVQSWSGRGPSALGGVGADILANGAWGAGDFALNEWGDGWTAWDSWGGTSRSTPIAAGNLALVYDAYEQAHGDFPTYDTARTLLLSGANDVQHDPFLQGAGSLNADRSTDLAGELYGVHVTPTSWRAGDYRGSEYEGFAHIMHPGTADNQTFTVSNVSTKTITATISDGYYRELGTEEWTFSTKNQAREEGLFTKPDYLFDITDLVAPGGEYVNADLMAVKVVRLYEEFSASDPSTGDLEWDNIWRVMAYDWTDVNDDGDVWTDVNGDGIVNTDEIDAGEYIRYNYGYSYGTVVQMTVKDPSHRYHDGLFLGLRHRDWTDRVPSTVLRFQITFYQRADWPWLTTDVTSLEVPGESSATFEATVNVPADQPLGTYEGLIMVEDPGDAEHAAHTTVLPVIVNIAAASTDFAFGRVDQDTPYDNGNLFGYFDWSWADEAGDWRFFFADVPDDHGLPEGTKWLVHTAWGSYPTDIDTLVLGPTEDDFSVDDPDVFGPYTLDTVGRSENAHVEDGKWTFKTSSGSIEEWVSAPITAGLHLFELHNVLYSGKLMQEPVDGDVGTITAQPYPLEITTERLSGSAVMTVTSSMNLPSLVVSAIGLGQPTVYTDLPVIQDDPDDPSTASYTYTVTIENGGLLEATTSNPSGASDIDLFVLYDANADSVFDWDTEVIGSSTTPTGNESVSISFPSDGDYLIAVHGWGVAPGDTFNLTINAVYGTDLSVSDVPEEPISAGVPVTFTINYTKATFGTWYGLILFGPGDAPGASSVPVTIHYIPVSRIYLPLVFKSYTAP